MGCSENTDGRNNVELVRNKEKIAEYRKRAKELVAQMTLEEKVEQTLNWAPAIERLGIKKYNWWNEALHGVARAGVATVFPQAIGLAATFDEDLLNSYYETMKELQEEVKSLNLPYAPCNELSMGMSNDYVVAVKNGATMIRLGRILLR